jgi:hypothetical protein
MPALAAQREVIGRAPEETAGRPYDPRALRNAGETLRAGRSEALLARRRV